MFIEIPGFKNYWYCEKNGEIYSDKRGALILIPPSKKFRQKAYILYKEKLQHVVLYKHILEKIFNKKTTRKPRQPEA